MGERKVLNKYYPPDFDPAKLPRGKRPEHNSMKVRMMLPMSVQCQTCGTFMYKGTKFNMKKEDVDNDTYLGIQIFRFYWRCSACAAEITMKTDPKNADYTMELGATRNYEPWREKDKAVALTKAQREEEERGNAMKALENRTLDSRREMDIMTALDELQSLNSRHNHVTPEAALAAIRRSGGLPEAETLDDEDEALIRQMVQQTRSKRLEEPEPVPAAGTSSQQHPHTNGSHRQPEPPSQGAPDRPAAAAAKPGAFGVRPGVVKVALVQKRPAAAASEPAQPQAKQQKVANGSASPEGGGLAGLGSYGSDDSP